MENLLITILLTSIPILLAGLGELVTEKSGVLNLGVEGMMLCGAVAALGSVLIFGNPYIGILFGAVAGILISTVFSFFTIIGILQKRIFLICFIGEIILISFSIRV